MAAIIAMATDIIDNKVTVFAISNIWFQGMDGGVQKGGKNWRTPSTSPLGEGARYQSLSSSRLQPSSIVSSCSRHLGGGRGGGRHCRRNTNGHKHCHGTQHHPHQEYDRSRHHQHISVGDGGGKGERRTPSPSPLGREKTVVVVIANATVVNILMMQLPSRREEEGGHRRRRHGVGGVNDIS